MLMTEQSKHATVGSISDSNQSRFLLKEQLWSEMEDPVFSFRNFCDMRL